MSYIIVFFIGFIASGICLGMLLITWYGKVKAAGALEKRTRELQDQLKVQHERFNKEMTAAKAALDAEKIAVQEQREGIARYVISYKELQSENALIKRDMQNLDVTLNKLQLDVELQAHRQTEIDERSRQLAERYLAESVKAIVDAVGPDNFTACKQKLVTVIQRCRDIGFAIDKEEEIKLIADLKAEFEKAVRAQIEREEQAKIKAQIREEERLQREVDRELKQLERERAAIQAALDQALATAHDQHSAEIEQLRARLAEAEERSQRAISMAQQTKAGHVYVISNIGSFGEGIFKIGMTRRLEPKERVDELGCAAVPFPFDVHMMIRSTDAPKLENALHRALHNTRMNLTNPRKEFFRTEIQTIHRIVVENHGEVQYRADPEALQYRQSLTMSDADAAFIESVYDGAEEDAEVVADDT